MWRFADVLRSLVGAGSRGPGPPRAASEASSFHLIWEMFDPPGSDTRWIEMSAVLEVLVPPRVNALYFWALQVDLADDLGVWGGAHTGLQWNGRYPGNTAVNWGGYLAGSRSDTVLAGTRSVLPGFPDDPNTVAYAWEPECPYRFRVYRSPDIPGAWRSEVTDLASGLSTAIRDLMPQAGRGLSGSHLLRPIVWSEVFAGCDAPSVRVRWSDLAAIDESGASKAPAAVRVHYQAVHEGGCSNTSAAVDERGLLQITNTKRTVEQGVVVPSPGADRN